MIVVAHIAVKILKSVCSSNDANGKLAKKLGELQGQFRYNIYIRYMMMAYLDFVFIAGIVIFDME